VHAAESVSSCLNLDDEGGSDRLLIVGAEFKETTAGETVVATRAATENVNANANANQALLAGSILVMMKKKLPRPKCSHRYRVKRAVVVIFREVVVDLTLLEADEAEAAAAAAARDETVNDWDIAVSAWRPKTRVVESNVSEDPQYETFNDFVATTTTMIVNN
jgi:hypothetical protein